MNRSFRSRNSLKMPKSPELSDTDKKVSLLKYIVNAQQRMLRLNALAKWCKQRSDMGIHYDWPQNTVDFALTVVLDPAHIPHVNAAGGAVWLPYCVSVRLRYTFGDNPSVTFLGMEGSHGGRACWQRVGVWEQCKQRLSRTVEVNGSVVARDLTKGKIKLVADSVQRTLHLCLRGRLREGSSTNNNTLQKELTV